MFIQCASEGVLGFDPYGYFVFGRLKDSADGLQVQSVGNLEESLSVDLTCLKNPKSNGYLSNCRSVELPLTLVPERTPGESKRSFIFRVSNIVCECLSRQDLILQSPVLYKNMSNISPWGRGGEAVLHKLSPGHRDSSRSSKLRLIGSGLDSCSLNHLHYGFALFLHPRRHRRGPRRPR